MYDVLISNGAVKYYKKLDSKTKRKLNKCIDSISFTPFYGVHIKKLHGKLEGKHRYEVGSLRIIYEVDKNNNTVKIIAIGSSDNIYK